jgi:O-6-methylguanine DNA methyltransferase
MTLYRDEIPSPIGTIVVVSDDEALRALDFDDHAERFHELLRRHYGDVELKPRRETLGIRKRLDAYFDGDLHAIDDLPTRTNGTKFQMAVWAALRTIPVGTTTSYGALASALGNPAATRAVGLANGANPVGIVVPCHRVIGANGTLTGYGGGLARKAWLLRHEQAAFVASPDPNANAERELTLFA